MNVVTLHKQASNGGIYTLKEAARLLEMPNTANIRRWVFGDKRGEPIIHAQYKPISNAYNIGFWDLLEVRFIRHFRAQNISLQHLRKAAAKAREIFQNDHPFAMSSVPKFVSDRKEVFVEMARETGDTDLMRLVDGQYTMYEMIEQVLAKGMEFDPKTELAKRWRPKPGEFPNVILDPLIAFGRPVVLPERITTRALCDSWQAEHQDIALVSEWYDVAEDRVCEAIEFEISLSVH